MEYHEVNFQNSLRKCSKLKYICKYYLPFVIYLYLKPSDLMQYLFLKKRRRARRRGV